jgi:hypothetical protein
MASKRQVSAQKKIGQLPHQGKTPVGTGNRAYVSASPRPRLGRVTIRPTGKR